MKDKALSISVYGKVQGVFFRKSTQEKAQALNLKGWVRNEPDGSVLIHVQGPSVKAFHLAEWCNTGSAWSKVDRVVVKETELLELDRFYIDRT